jgi:arginine decarboxylase
MPIHRLDEMPTRQAVLADVTCDSDGKIDKFIDLRDVKRVLPLHETNDSEYYIGAFLLGAYQETLGDMHNLLGDVNVLHVRIGKTGRVEYAREVAGDSVEDVLSYVEYDTTALRRRVRRKVETAFRNDRIGAKERDRIREAFKAAMEGYTYLEP